MSCQSKRYCTFKIICTFANLHHNRFSLPHLSIPLRKQKFTSLGMFVAYFQSSLSAIAIMTNDSNFRVCQILKRAIRRFASDKILAGNLSETGWSQSKIAIFTPNMVIAYPRDNSSPAPTPSRVLRSKMFGCTDFNKI